MTTKSLPYIIYAFSNIFFFVFVINYCQLFVKIVTTILQNIKVNWCLFWHFIKVKMLQTKKFRFSFIFTNIKLIIFKTNLLITLYENYIHSLRLQYPTLLNNHFVSLKTQCSLFLLKHYLLLLKQNKIIYILWWNK